MAKVAVILAQGFEEIEALTVVDVLRRANISCDMVGFEEQVTGSHDIQVKADHIFDGDLSDYDLVVLPGGMPGSAHLRDNQALISQIKAFDQAGKKVAAICAAPIVLSKAGVLTDKEATSYPGFDNEINCKLYNNEKAVIVDKNVITAQGPAVAILFGYEIVNYLLQDDTAQNISNAMLVPTLKNNL